MDEGGDGAGGGDPGLTRVCILEGEVDQRSRCSELNIPAERMFQKSNKVFNGACFHDLSPVSGIDSQSCKNQCCNAAFVLVFLAQDDHKWRDNAVRCFLVVLGEIHF